MNSLPSPTDSLRRSIYTLLIAAATAMAIGRILAAVRVNEPDYYRAERPSDSDFRGKDDYRPTWPTSRPAAMPTFSSNDRSRWATVRTLVDEGTYVVGRRTMAADGTPKDSGIVFEPGWETVDKVLNPKTLEFYSSKPPLLATLVAGEYWVVKKLFGWSFHDHPFAIVRFILITINALPLILYLALLARVAETYGQSDWGRLYLVVAAAFGTLVTPFLITFNNHSIAAVSTMVALAATLHIWSQPRGSASVWCYLLAGLSAGFTATNELPALALTAGVFLVLLPRSPARALLVYLPAAALPLLALLGTNYLAMGEIDLAYSKFGGPWYEYPGSHWLVEPGKPKHGIDWAGEYETRGQYIFHVLLGHHGLFSLTPLFVLGFVGMFLGMVRRASSSPPTEANGAAPTLPWVLFPAALALSIVVIGFYLTNKTVNYGGFSAGPRWLIWLTPLWLVTMIPVLDRLAGSRWGRGIAVGLLVLSVMSASYPAWNPWRHPWIYRFLDSQGLIPY